MRRRGTPSLVEGGNDGAYTKIPHEYLLYLARLKLAPNEWRVLMIVLRHTLGWHRRYAVLSLRFIAKATGIRREHVARALAALRENDLIARVGEKIQLLPVSALPNVQLPLLAPGEVPESAREGVPELAPNKDISSKIGTKDSAAPSSADTHVGEDFQQQPLTATAEQRLEDAPVNIREKLRELRESMPHRRAAGAAR